VKRPARAGAVALALTVMLAASACFSGHRRERPSAWPSSVETGGEGCQSLSGSYQGEALPDPFFPTKRSLPDLLQAVLALPASGKESWMNAPVVRLDHDPATDQLRFTAHPGGDQPPKAWAFQPGTQFECLDGSLTISPPARWGNANVCAARTAQQLQLWRAVDGTLVARTSSQELCLGMALGFAWDAEWYRFRPATPAASAP
jgi:hypothetical protein